MTSPSLTQIYQVFIKASPERIWEAIIKPEYTTQYFHGAHFSFVCSPQPAAEGNHYVSRGPDGSVWGEGPVFEYDPPRRLSYEWRSQYDEELAAEPPSRVTMEIEPRDGGYCLLTLTHDRLDASPKTARSVSGEGWMFVLSGLKTLVETDKPLSG